MQKHLLYINLFTITSALALAACSDEVENAITPEVPAEKTPIELTVGGVVGIEQSAITRASASAVITENVPDKMIDFPEDTNIFMVMQSVYDESNPDFNDPDYSESEPHHKIKTTIARGTVAKDQNAVVFDDANKRYWDDAHARSSQLAIWAYAQMYKPTWIQCTFQRMTDDSKTGWERFEDAQYNTSTSYFESAYNWKQDDVYPGIKKWNVTHNPDGSHDDTSVLCQDLLFSNNIANNTDYSKGDNRLKFNFTDRKFPATSQMYFRHALSKIVIHIKKGTGFVSTESFKFDTGTGNIKLKGFNRIGAFNIKEGEFQYIWDSADIPQIYQHTTADDGDAFTLEALAIPNIHQFMSSLTDGTGSSLNQKDENSRFVSNGTNKMMEFTIEGNKYEISSKQLYDALHVDGDPTKALVTNAVSKNDNGTYIPLEAGKKYVFTFSIGKKQIDNISAQVVDWATVEAAQLEPSNAYVTLELKTDEGTAINTAAPQIDLYRAKDPTSYTGTNYNQWAVYKWETGYTATDSKANLSQLSSDGTVYTAKDATAKDESDNPIQWVWPDNTTYYHFRTINKGLSITGATGSATNDVVSIYSGPINDTYNATNGISASFADDKFNDYLWGAPFKSTVATNTIYSKETGFCNNETPANGQIYKAIGATEGNITLIQHHMMSNIYVDLETTTGSDKVNLTDATVKILRFAKDAKIQMGDGLVKGWTNYDDGTGAAMTAQASASGVTPAYDYTYRMVPQSLSYTSGSETKKIGIEITTADGNVYKIDDLSQQKVNGSNPEEKIIYWLPGKKYYYKFVLKKTGIESLSATIVDWEKVVAAEDEVVIQ